MSRCGLPHVCQQAKEEPHAKPLGSTDLESVWSLESIHNSLNSCDALARPEEPKPAGKEEVRYEFEAGAWCQMGRV